MPDEVQVIIETEDATSEETETETPEGGLPAELGEAGKKALDAEREQRKAAEKTAKELKTRLEALERSQMSDQEKAIQEAIDRTKAEARVEFGGALVEAAVKVASAGRLDADQIDTILENADLAKFLSEDGDVDTAKVQSYVDAIAPKGGGTSADFGQGQRSTTALGSDPLLQALKNTVGIR